METEKSRGKCKKDDGEEEEDRISKLPHVLQHHILSFLSPAESARASVLSKTWFHSWSTNPDLHLDHSLFRKTQIELSGPSNYYPTLEDDETRKFETYVNKTLTRYQQQKIDVQSLSLSVKILDSKFASKVEEWVKIAINMATSPHLHINIVYLSSPTSRALVQLLLASHLLRSLSVTALAGCLLQPSLFSNATIKCKSLKILELRNVGIKESEIEYLLSCCPFIEMIFLRLCTGFLRICVANLCRLEKFIVEVAKDDMLMVEIDAPKLKLFSYTGNWRKPGVVNIKPTQYLEYLHLSGTLITNRDHINNLSSSFPRLKCLVIERPQGLKRIDISSQSLKIVKIIADLDLGQIEGEVDAPGLHSFCFFGCIPSVTFSKHTNPESRMLYACPSNGFDTSFFIDLRDFALKHKLSKVGVSLLHEPTGAVDLEELSGVVAAGGASQLEVEELHLATRSLSSEEYLIECLFCIFRPKLFHVRCLGDDTDAEIFLCGFFSEHREVKNLDCCVSNQVKCWRHYLKQVEIESFEKNENLKRLVSWKFKLLDGSTNNCRSI